MIGTAPWARIVSTLLVAAGTALVGCTSAVRQAVEPLYHTVELAPGVTVREDIAYLEAGEAHPEKHRLDLYLPSPAAARGDRSPWMVFVHGGSLLQGDKDLEVAGLDFYGNIGRFYSARGVVVALVNYRLQPDVHWREQVADVAAAVRWVRDEKRARGASGRLVLAGHSAGAWLAARVALDARVRAAHGLEGVIDGLVSVSGSGFEMTDERTWEMYDREDWWAERFAVEDPALDWRAVASVAPLTGSCGCGADVDGAGRAASGARSALRVLLLYSNRELPALARQNRLLAEALEEAGIEHRLVAVSSESHRRTVMAMSHPEKVVSREIFRFLETGRLSPDPVRPPRFVRP